MKNEEFTSDIFYININKEDWEYISNKLVIVESSLKIIKNKSHFQNLRLMSKNKIEKFNHFGYDLDDEKYLTLPILNISFIK